MRVSAVAGVRSGLAGSKLGSHLWATNSLVKWKLISTASLIAVQCGPSNYVGCFEHLNPPGISFCIAVLFNRARWKTAQNSSSRIVSQAV